MSLFLTINKVKWKQAIRKKREQDEKNAKLAKQRQIQLEKERFLIENKYQKFYLALTDRFLVKN